MEVIRGLGRGHACWLAALRVGEFMFLGIWSEPAESLGLLLFFTLHERA